MRILINTLALALLFGATVAAAGCDPAQLQDPAAQTATSGVQQLGPTTPAPQIAQALANGQPIDIDQQDPNGNWRYSVQSKGAGDINVAFQLGGGTANGQSPSATAAGIHQRVKDKLAASRARHAQRRQALQDRLAAMKSGAATATPHAQGLPIQASFNIHIGGDFDPAALNAQLAQLQQSAKAQQGAGGQGLTWTLGAPKGAGATAPPAAVAPSHAAQAAQAAAPGTRLFHVGSVPVTSGPARNAPASATPSNAPAQVALPVDEGSRDAVEETAELYLWLGSRGDLDEARDLVSEPCLDGPVGQAQAVTFLDQPLELTESTVRATRLRSDSATVSYDLTGTLSQEGEEGEAITSSVNLTGELTLVNTPEGWLVSCPE